MKLCTWHNDGIRFRARSYGQPRMLGGAIHPAAIVALRSAGMAVPSVEPSSWDQFAPRHGFQAHVVITLEADTLASQPRWPGQPDIALWSYPDAAAIDDLKEFAHVALQILYSLRRRLELLTSLPLHGADREPAPVRDPQARIPTPRRVDSAFAKRNTDVHGCDENGADGRLGGASATWRTQAAQEPGREHCADSAQDQRQGRR